MERNTFHPNTVGMANLSEFFSAPYRTVYAKTVYRSEK
jgi:hypothetical protein